jgi:hypothetical protein
VPRTIDTATLAAVVAAAATRVHLLEIQYGAGTVRWTTAPVNLTWGGFTWTAIGGALSIGEVTENTDPQGAGLSLTLGAVDPAIVSVVLSNNARGRAALVRLAFLSSAGAVLVDPLLLFSGFMNDTFTVDENRPQRQGEPATVTVSTRVVSRLVEFGRLRLVACDPLTHNRFAGGDAFFSLVTSLAGKTVLWGRAAAPSSSAWGVPGYYTPNGSQGGRPDTSF